MKSNEIKIRDPFIYVSKEEKLYYMYGTCGGENLTYFTSPDLENWCRKGSSVNLPENLLQSECYWAPEVHKYNNKFYMFVTFKLPHIHRGTYILTSDKPYDFKPLTGQAITPKDWECLDGTLWIEKGKPYIIFCHEWAQIKDGTIVAQELSKDLKTTIGEPVTLFNGSCPLWAVENAPQYVTDGPFIIKSPKKNLLMIWSSYGKDGKYKIGIAKSKSVLAYWTQLEETLKTNDGGHAMIFKDLNGKLKITFHAPNVDLERPIFKDIKITENKIEIL